jgi:hypothetical protein
VLERMRFNVLYTTGRLSRGKGFLITEINCGSELISQMKDFL